MKLLQNTLLETFVKVVECGGFSDAQFALGVTQSAISIRIKDLETSLGYKVCERGRSGFRLTERGEIAYNKAREILRNVRDFDAELLELRDAITGELRVGIVDAVRTLPDFSLTETLRCFLERQLEVRLEIQVASPTQLTQWLIAGELDVAIAPFRSQLPELDYIELCDEEHRLYCGNRHPLNDESKAVDSTVLTAYPLCQRSYDMMVSSDLGTQDPKAVVANMEAMAMLIETGHYLGALPVHFAKNLVEQGKIHELSNEHLRWNSTFFIAMRRKQVHRRAVELFVRDAFPDNSR